MAPREVGDAERASTFGEAHERHNRYYRRHRCHRREHALAALHIGVVGGPQVRAAVAPAPRAATGPSEAKALRSAARTIARILAKHSLSIAKDGPAWDQAEANAC